MGEQPRDRTGTTVVVGVDATDTAAHALAYAIGVARRQQARLLLVHVLPFDDFCLDVTGRFRAAMPVEPDTRWLDALVAELTTSSDLEVRVIRCLGDPSARLLEAARDEWADLIIVGQPRGVVHRWAGAVGRKLQRRAGVPVTVVP